jgi:hypothetical protein
LREVVISVTENLFTDGIGYDGRSEKFHDIVNQTINSYLSTAVEAARRLPQTKFALIKPILYPMHSW